MFEEDCLFCKIVRGEIPAKKVFETKDVIAFNDIYPQAVEHYLFIHREHTKNANSMVAQKPEHLTAIFKAIREFTQQTYLETSGFRVVTNIGANAGQTVFHTHFHVLGGEKLGTFGSNSTKSSIH
ncbi:MAG: histidine triad nucleotide-binding protein [Bacteriovoracaceae bacterium]|nr:histidine triad nucleotide-binding protein [Bacteriovoracaceae bacterium]